MDFTPGRRGARGAVVGCYMAHHMGMSLAAIANRLCCGVMQRRFMADRAMQAYRSLLEEKAPLGGAVLRSAARDIPQRPARWDAAETETRTEQPDAAAKRRLSEA